MASFSPTSVRAGARIGSRGFDAGSSPRRRVGGFGFLLILGACVGSGEEGTEATFVGRDACTGCHADQVAAFSGSDHDHAMAHADSRSVRGDFRDASFIQGADTALFHTRDGRYWVETRDGSAEPVEVEVLYTFGWEPLQQYLVAAEGGRLQRLPYSWDTRPAADGGQRWFHTSGDQPAGPGSFLHWTSPSQNWNTMCADCHSTNLLKRYQVDTDRFDTGWSEIDVSCEACHGPASRHLVWAEQNASGVGRDLPGVGFSRPVTRGTTWVMNPGEATASPSGPTDRTAEESCAACHAHRSPLQDDPTAAFHDRYSLSLTREPLYYADGQVREEVFVYGSFLQSRMHGAGVTCSDCHDSHSTRVFMEGNALCVRCHSAAAFDQPSHTGHPAGTPGSQCVDCHMPETVFMQVDARRDHSFRIPRPAAGVAGTPTPPNACLGCHGDRDPGWADEAMDRWYGPQEGLPRGVRAAVALADADQGTPAALGKLLALLADTDQPPITVATAVSLLGSYPGREAVSVLRALRSHPEGLVRAAVARAAGFGSPNDRHGLLRDLVVDSLRSVRVAAARQLRDLDVTGLSLPDQEPLLRARREYRTSLAVNADGPSGRVAWADQLAREGRMNEALESYRLALAMEASFTPAWLNLADALRTLGREAEGTAVLEDGLEAIPGDPTLLHALGLAQVREGRLDHATATLARAWEAAPDDPAILTAYGLALLEVGQGDRARTLTREALDRRPDHPGLTALLRTLDNTRND